MEEIYKEIWRTAKPYYEKGRPMDIDHIEWIMDEVALVCEKEKVDESILMPLAILHDVGYSSFVDKNSFNMDIRMGHMKTGAVVSEKILKKVNYPEDKIKKIKFYISHHDDWAIGNHEIFKEHEMLGLFNDIDYIWTVTPRGFVAVSKILGLDEKEMVEWIENNNKTKLRPFCTKITKNLYEKYFSERKRDVLNHLN